MPWHVPNKTIMSITPPPILKGTRDFTPAQMRQRQQVMKVLQNTFENYGFSYIETPILNPAETILGKYGEEGDKLTYSFLDNGDRKIALPYDLTVPFARYVAQYWRDLPMPFKRYQMQRVWRAEKPQKGRLREFYQCDIDVIGTNSLLCEAEIISIIYQVFTKLNIPGFKIQINSRRLMNAILNSFGVSGEQVTTAIRIIDKLGKIDEATVITELNAAGIARAAELMATLGAGLAGLTGFDTSEIDQVLSYVSQLGVPAAAIQVTPTLARGLDYYTGLVIETVVPDSGLGTVCAGGRYDNLCGTFCDQSFSGIGVSFGFERIMLLLEAQLATTPASTTTALVTLFNEAATSDTLTLFNQLQKVGVATEMYFQPDKLQKQFKYANQKNIPFVVIQGPDEKEAGSVTVKQMQSGTQKTIPVQQLADYVKGFYA